ncbi:indole-3-glycerol phosphate synthase TrpC [Paenilisteria rocourtiae]|uniref:Indole-3-glycerol phosphate synthase n=1 Tax=Listeria rocourtiae TaxID=647910 RepID=A0A4R6ZLZ9_9LIST|nr:indole-3-glycerol phosphate synthase TrpC [Listeria rocourtiae]EUJ45001.1 indole-3-glycerol-phosphate synthase [Listeria rocourtiae FSL F6-920]MBC1604007.1 indole-3-glycerol phosphate synthase TrpC [Listeria rocourtiae]TDR53481.1 indole-3-glycerol phosphate synthase [Listeria rocourtiae]
MTFLEEILAKKAQEVAEMPLEKAKLPREKPYFYDFLRENTTVVQLIAEVKRASPSKGAINLDVDPVAQAKSYEATGAGAISVLTDQQFFKGDIEDLRAVAQAVGIPVLCKDFIISEKQLIRAKNAGASIVLLIVAALSEQALTTLFKQASALDLEVLVEVHNEVELKIAEQLGAKLIGVNNRDLHSFVVDIAVSERVAREFSRSDAFYISESGIREPEDVARVAKSFSVVLVGEALMRANQVEQAASALKVSRL